ncbi:hypothetical protein L596_018211 [Steinernema carpocapsae]|uniref:Checkpoint protein n=1 Tax=Steinernema carpocapsae TaxID=34508 RepID=A0A4U5N3Z8_STECR|nr:hypothetical protein L596_018211 [Steinernema carpocapsae]
MRFKADISDHTSVEATKKLVMFMSKLNKRRCIIHATPDEFVLLNDSSTTRSYWVEVKLNPLEMFCDYEMSGLTPGQNEIFMDLSAADLSQALSGVETSIKMRLTKEGNVPHLGVRSENVTNSIPVTLLMSRHWKEFERSVPEELLLISIFMPSIKSVQRIIQSIKNIQAKHTIFAVNFKGQLEISARTDTSRFCAQIRDLGIDRTPNSRDAPEEAIIRTVLDTKHLHTFVSSIPNTFSYIKLAFYS